MASKKDLRLGKLLQVKHCEERMKPWRALQVFCQKTPEFLVQAIACALA